MIEDQPIVSGECKKNCKFVDLILPVALDKHSFERMTAIHVQVKLWEDPREPSREAIQAINLVSCLGCSSNDLPPSLTIYLQLNSKGQPKMTSLVEHMPAVHENSNPNELNLACLYVQGIENFPFLLDLKKNLYELCGTVASDLDLDDQKICDSGFDILSSANQLECKLCHSSSNKEKPLAHCSVCQSLYHLQCDLDSDEISLDECQAMKNQITKTEGWKCSNCRRCSLCGSNRNLVTRCFVCLNWVHKSCMYRKQPRKYKFLVKKNEEITYEFFSHCYQCSKQ